MRSGGASLATPLRFSSTSASSLDRPFLAGTDPRKSFDPYFACCLTTTTTLKVLFFCPLFFLLKISARARSFLFLCVFMYYVCACVCSCFSELLLPRPRSVRVERKTFLLLLLIFARALCVCVCVRLLYIDVFVWRLSLFPVFSFFSSSLNLGSLPLFSFFRGPPQKTVKPCSLLCSLISRISFSLLLLDFFFALRDRPTKKSIDFPKNSIAKQSLSLSCHFASYINALNTHTKQNGPFDAIRHFSWQANYFREGFFQTVRLRSRDVVLY